MFNFLKKKPEREVTPGGSAIYRHDNVDTSRLVLPQNIRLFADEIDEHFHKQFPDRETTLYHEVVSNIVHIDINILKPKDRDFHILYTTGMSDLPMTIPDTVKERDKLMYAELYMYLPAEWRPEVEDENGKTNYTEDYWAVKLLLYLARFPHLYKTWLCASHTIEYYPITKGSLLNGILLERGEVEPLVAKDGNTVNFYKVVPITKEEMAFKLKYGYEYLSFKFIEQDFPLVIDVKRKSLI